MIKLTGRLEAAASFIQKGESVADIGTDHAYLPIWLAENEISQNILASDINGGPVRRAKENAALYGYEKYITVVKAGGLDALKNFKADCIIIAGMGGELIRDIIEKDARAAREAKKLIFQPMTRAAALRQYLYNNGFDITGERLSKDGGKIFEIICARYEGGIQNYPGAVLLLGKKNIEAGGVLFLEYAENKLAVLKKVIAGKKTAGLSAENEENTAAEIEIIIKAARGPSKNLKAANNI